MQEHKKYIKNFPARDHENIAAMALIVPFKPTVVDVAQIIQRGTEADALHARHKPSWFGHSTDPSGWHHSPRIRFLDLTVPVFAAALVPAGILDGATEAHLQTVQRHAAAAVNPRHIKSILAPRLPGLVEHFPPVGLVALVRLQPLLPPARPGTLSPF
jgi:hypothetical protein